MTKNNMNNKGTYLRETRWMAIKKDRESQTIYESFLIHETGLAIANSAREKLIIRIT